MRDHGFVLTVEDVQDQVALKQRFDVPPSLQSCHTAIVDGYVIEGHVPVSEVNRLLTERPNVIGLAVPGMPAGSPGMESAGGAVQPYDVLTFDANGNTTVYASYGQ